MLRLLAILAAALSTVGGAVLFGLAAWSAMLDDRPRTLPGDDPVALAAAIVGLSMLAVGAALGRWAVARDQAAATASLRETTEMAVKGVGGFIGLVAFGVWVAAAFDSFGSPYQLIALGLAALLILYWIGAAAVDWLRYR